MLIKFDFSYLESTSCYCSEESSILIRKEIENTPLSAVHYIGTGDYHYISLFYLEQISEDFILVLIDNHPDDQTGAFDADLLSCGSWVLKARQLEHCRGDVWINSSSQTFSEIASSVLRPPRNDRKVHNDEKLNNTVIASELQATAWQERGNLGIYLSIDLDVLSPEFAHTDWNQGTMTLPQLIEIIEGLKSNYHIIGVDICGGISESKGGTQEDKDLNERAISLISKLFD